MQRRCRGTAAAATTLALLCTVTAYAQECTDGNSCTIDDMCSEDMCQGTPTLDAVCELHVEGFINGRCVASGSDTVCRGERAPAGTPCQRGCGTLQVPFEGSADLICKVEDAMVGQPCSFDLCRVGVCKRANGPFLEGYCDAPLKECPDTDGDPCTREECLGDTGQCKSYPACAETCETCDPATGMCTATNVGVACDRNPCTSASHCEAEDIPGLGLIGLCKAGPGTTPTPTATAVAPTPTLGPCAGDCDHDGKVKVNELVTGVNIALDRASIDACPSFDESGNDRVEVNELVRGVNGLLRGCTAEAR